MPIRSTTAIPIVPKSPGLESKFLTLNAGVAGEHALGMNRLRQQQSNWCWAACVDMVLDFYGEASVRQCAVVGKKVKKNCCADANNNDYDVSCEPEDMRAVWKQFGIHSRAHLGPDTGDSGWIQPNELVAELSDGRPVQLGLKWHGIGGHAIVVQGWKDSSKGTFFLVNDPWDWTDLPKIVKGKGQIHYKELRQAYGMGKWKWTWTELERV